MVVKSYESKSTVDRLKELEKMCNENCGDRKCVDDMDIIEALEKQIPKKPIIVEADVEGMDMETGEVYTYKIDEAHCSACDSIIGSEYDIFDSHYCNICGQRIDWSCWQ